MNGNGYSNGHVNGSSGSYENGHPPPPQQQQQEQRPENLYYCDPSDRIAIVGAGVAGIAMAAALQNANYTNFVVYDKQSDLGGLWLQNYPDVAGTNH